MSTFIALFRGINVGNAKRVPMRVLRTVLGDLGFGNVRTLMNSGNAVFDATGSSAHLHAKAIAAAIVHTLSIDVPVIVKSAGQLDGIVAENPFVGVAMDPSRLFVAFTQEAHGLAVLKKIESLASPAERFVVGGHAAYLHCTTGILHGNAGVALLGKHGKTATTRNWATTLKRHALAIGSA